MEEWNLQYYNRWLYGLAMLLELYTFICSTINQIMPTVYSAIKYINN